MHPRNAFVEFNTLAQFVGDLRSRVFRTKKGAADHFGLHHTTIGRYEDDDPATHSRPPLGYVACLTQMHVERLGAIPSSDEPLIQGVLAQINSAIDLCYPGQSRLRSWAELQRLAAGYRQPAARRQENVRPSESVRHDWGIAPDITDFHGRTDTLEQLTGWILYDRCRVVGIFGMGGIGKTWLAAAVAQQVAPHFTHLIWRSLRDAPPLQEILQDYIRFLSDQQLFDLPTRLDQRLALLINLLRAKRCLLVLDNLEAILKVGEGAGQYQSEHTGYGDLLRTLAESEHQSCLVLTSRETPAGLLWSYTGVTPLCALRVQGLKVGDIRAMLANMQISGSEANWRKLVAHFSGNPLALQLIAEWIRDFFAGQIVDFLAADIPFLSDVRTLLDEQFQRLSSSEQDVLFWLAILREPASLDWLVMAAPTLPASVRLDGLRALQRRCWVEPGEARFGLQNVILEYLTARFVQEMSTELLAGVFNRASTHALLLAQAKYYIRDTQARLLLQPVAHFLCDVLGPANAIIHLQTLKAARQQQHLPPDYSGANLLHLLTVLRNGDLTGEDFARLTFIQAVLHDVDLRRTSFAEAEFIHCAFTESFGIVDALAFSPDGRRLAVGAGNDAIHLWQLTIHTLRAVNQEAVYELTTALRFESAFSGDGVSLPMTRERRLRAMAFAPNGCLLAAGFENGAIGVWEARQGCCLFRLTGHIMSVRALSFAATSHLLMSATIRLCIRIWDVEQGVCIEEIQAPGRPTKALAFSPAAPLLAIGARDGTITLWNWQTRQSEAVLQAAQGDEVLCLAFSSDGALLVSGEYHGALRVWDVPTGQLLYNFQGHVHEVRNITFGHSKHIFATVSHDGSVRLWDAVRGLSLRVWDGRSHALSAIAMNVETSVVVAGARDGNVRLWSMNAEQCLIMRRGWPHRLWGLDVCPSNDLLACGGDECGVQLWAWPTGTSVRILMGHTQKIMALAFRRDGRVLASAGDDTAVRLWDAHSGVCLHVLHGHTSGVHAVAFHPAGGMVASGGYDNTIRLWEVEHGSCFQVLQACSDTVRTLAFSPDGALLAAGSSDHFVYLWDGWTGAPRGKLPRHPTPVWSIAFCPGQPILASAEERIIRLWNLHSFAPMTTFLGCYPVVFHPNGEWLFTLAIDHVTPQLVHVQSGERLRTYERAGDFIQCLVVSADGQHLFGTGEEGVIRCWSVATGLCTMTIQPERCYERMKITGVRGLTETEMTSLKLLGAVD